MVLKLETPAPIKYLITQHYSAAYLPALSSSFKITES
jgi:hypothetical protein